MYGYTINKLNHVLPQEMGCLILASERHWPGSRVEDWPDISKLPDDIYEN